MNRKPRTNEEIYGEAVERLISAATGDPRIRALWLEAPVREELRRPWRRIEIHLAADEPDFDALLADLPSLVAGPDALAGVTWSEVPRFAQEMKAHLDGAQLTVVLEKSSLLAKRPRSAVASLVDKTGHLYHVMDFRKVDSRQSTVDRTDG